MADIGRGARSFNSKPMKSPARSARPVRFAVVGLGHIAQAAVLPAFKHARPHVELTALVSDTPAKLKTARPALWREDSSVPTTTRATCSRSGDIDAVYIALPNTQHAAWTIRAAEAGLHVLCEKPLATTVQDCERMIEACERNGVQLMTAYRLHFERCNLEVADIVRKKAHRRGALLRLAVLDAGEGRQHPPRARARRRPRMGHRHLLPERRALRVRR